MNDRAAMLAARLRGAMGSVAAKVVLVVAIFIACPVIVYFELREADAEKTSLVLRSLQEQGRLIAGSLSPALLASGGARAPELQKRIEGLDTGALNVKVLFRPTDPEKGDFFYVASRPAVSAGYLDRERTELVRTGILDKLGDTCAGDRALSVRYTNPAGETEVLSSMTPVHTDAGCWVVLTSYPAGAAFGRPYWKTPEVQIAAVIYVVMAILVFLLFFSVWRNLRDFGRLARTLREEPRAQGSFAALNRVPELADVAGEFDRLVARLGSSAKAIREAAEENAHAFKTPLAVISQSIEPLKRAAATDDGRTRRAVQLIERSVDRLDALVGAARHMDEAIADLISPPRERVALSRLLDRMIEAYREKAALGGVRLEAAIAEDVHVTAGEDLLETVFENLLDNALGFAPEGSTVTAVLVMRESEAEFTLTDEGPGVDFRDLEHIFDRYFSSRPAPSRAGAGDHYGMGLWIVRRNVEAVGGAVSASNRPEGGFRITVRFPRAG